MQADEPARAIAFYRAVFGWSFSRHDGSAAYWYVETGPRRQRGINGGLIPRREPTARGGANAWVCTIAVDSLEAALAAVERHGGAVVEREIEIARVGRLAYCDDCEGNRFAVIEYGGERGEEDDAEPDDG